MLAFLVEAEAVVDKGCVRKLENGESVVSG